MNGKVARRMRLVANGIIERGGMPKGWTPKKIIRRLKRNYMRIKAGLAPIHGNITVRPPKLAGGTRKARRNFLKKLKKKGATI